MEDEVLEMAREFYGFGSWEARYWFIGPEHRGNIQDGWVKTWRELARTGLCDCREFCKCIGQEKLHQERPPLQRTWRPLMRLLKAFLGKPYENDNLRIYQRDHWGMSGNDTCLIELSALPAKDFKESPKDREAFLQERIDTIRERMLAHKPELVVMYSNRDKQHYEKIGGSSFRMMGMLGFPAGFLKIGSTKIAFTTHPNTRRLTDEYWVELGKRLRETP